MYTDTHSSLYFIRQTAFMLLSRLFLVETALIFLYLITRLPKFFVSEMLTNEMILQWSFGSVLFFVLLNLIQLTVTLLLTLSWTNEYYIIRPTDILHRRGVFTTMEETFSLKNVESFTVDQGLIGKILNFGTIKFYSPVLKQEYYLVNVSDPIKLKNTIEETVSKMKINSASKNKEMIIPIRGR